METDIDIGFFNMKKETKKKMKLGMGLTLAVISVAFVSLSAIAKLKKGQSVYDDDLEQKNPLEGKKVQFIEDENDQENADGVKGHLEAIGNSNHRAKFYEKYIKRGVDIVLSFGGLIALSPIMGIIALAIKIEDPGPVLFIQKRLGQNKRYFKLHKFRSMKMCTPHDVPTHMLDNPDQYITKVGKFLRAHSLDELPQIWDIFIGNMSIIGPRPGLWNQDILIAERDKYDANDIKPGLTGWAQINGRDELEIPDKAKLDGDYVQNIGLQMDVKVFLKSLHVFGKDESVVEGGTGEIKKLATRHYIDGKSDNELIGHIGFGESVEIDIEKTKKVLITGAGSYIGDSFTEYARNNYLALKVDTVDMLGTSWKEKDFSKYDIVLHVAGIAHADVGNVDEETKGKYYTVNTDLAIEVCKKAKSEGVKEFIFMSSMIVYGDSASFGKNKIIDEHTVPIPSNFYGDSKLQADVAVRDLADDNFKVIVLRPPMIYGKGSKGNYPTLAKFAKKLPLFPDVNNRRSMLHINNLCEFLCQIMLIKEINERAIVLIPQNAEWTKISQMVKEISEVNGNNIKLVGGFMKMVVLFGGKVPGKIGNLVNKAFGNNCYALSLSKYKGLDYWIVDLKESIKETEVIEVNMNNYFEMKNEDKTVYKDVYKNQAKINVFIIGLRGYTQNYGGWEAFAHGLLDNWIDQDIHFYAFEKVDDFSKEEIIEVNGVTCIRVCEKESGNSAMMKYDKRCTDITCEIVKKYNIKNPVMFHLGVRIGPYLLLNRYKIKKLGIIMMENPAGAEWRRTKWNKLVQLYLLLSAIAMAKSTDCMVCDNEGIKNLYQKILIGRKPNLEYVAYGVESVPTVKEIMPSKVENFFDKWDLKKDQYYLVLGRFIPENNYEMMFKGFIKSKTNRKLLVICNYETEIKKFYKHIKESTEFENDKRIIMVGTLYDRDILHYVRQYAHGYIHGHSVGGTNPGLLEAMAETDINILFNVDFNRYVGGNATVYFSNENELAKIIEEVDAITDENRIEMGKKARQIMENKYSWRFICDEYSRVIHEICE